MPSLTYQELHARHTDAIRAEVAAALELAGPPGDLLRASCEELLRRQTMRYPLSVLPLAVHGAETGDPEPALPLAVVHLLWWTAACRLDDLADAEAAAPPTTAAASSGSHASPVSAARPDGAGARAVTVPGAPGHETVLTTLAAGSLLPLRLLDSPRLPGPVRPALTAEFTSCGLAAVAGQLADLRGGVNGSLRREAVLAAYRGKSGAPFAMITTMAAVLAAAEPDRVRRWRELGGLLGILWQLFNDQEDIVSGRHEDLRNGTVTHLLACAAERSSPAEAARLRLLRAAARTSPEARGELLELLLSGPALADFAQDLETYRRLAHALLDRLPGREPYASCLHDLIGQASRLSLRTPAPVV